jgi:hypothetical protein
LPERDRLKNKWTKITALALSFPTTIFISGWFLMKLHEDGVIPRWLAALLFIGFLGNTLLLMVVYAYKKKS